jgi:hypothetical protein
MKYDSLRFASISLRNGNRDTILKMAVNISWTQRIALVGSISTESKLFIPVLTVNWSHPPANKNTNPSLILQYSMMKCTSTTFTESPLWI